MPTDCQRRPVGLGVMLLATTDDDVERLRNREGEKDTMGSPSRPNIIHTYILIIYYSGRDTSAVYSIYTKYFARQFQAFPSKRDSSVAVYVFFFVMVQDF